ncbi:MAG: beta-ketoacyl-ACP synthase III [PVC group bacterium]
MAQEKIGIAGTGFYVPEKVLTNADLEKMVDTSNEWILARTGINERRIAAPGETAASMAEQASRQALKSAGLKPEQLDLIILGTFTPDAPLPAAACLLQARLGNTTAACFDISAACCGFIYALELAQKLLRGGRYRHALVAASEVLSVMTDWEDRNTCVLFGDGAGAAVLSKGAANGEIVDCYIGADGAYSSLLQVEAGGSACPITHQILDQRRQYIRMEGNKVFKLAVSSMVSAARRVLSQAGLTPQDVDWLLPHQANLRIMKAVAKGLKIPEERVYINVDRYGNMSGATVPVGLAEMDHNGVLKRGDLLLMVAFGGGLTWAASLVRW